MEPPPVICTPSSHPYPKALTLPSQPYRRGWLTVVHQGTRITAATFQLFEWPDGLFGLPYGMVLEATKAIAGGRDGVLVMSAARLSGAAPGAPPPQPSATTIIQGADPTDILPGGTYYFYVKTGSGQYTSKYLNLKRFVDWKPPTSVPDWWVLSNRPAEDPLRYVNQTKGATVAYVEESPCIITGAARRLEASHLVPNAEWPWFARHSEPDEGLEQALGGATNLIPLRSDLNMDCFDMGHFAIVPLRGQAICVFMNGANYELVHQAHGRFVELPGRIDLWFLFIWNVFKAAEEHPTTSGKHAISSSAGGSESSVTESAGSESGTGGGQPKIKKQKLGPGASGSQAGQDGQSSQQPRDGQAAGGRKEDARSVSSYEDGSNEDEGMATPPEIRNNHLNLDPYEEVDVEHKVANWIAHAPSSPPTRKTSPPQSKSVTSMD
ncbi:hypothetical protein B0H16DRAFT_1497153 [Mycena metata]|uniref:HNH nuclease domain-containing protein n=1 Tax=Mycena metata TaxID=1033252 RepID=A0AAD7NZ65_9AGAR|nr:hypothetical protein B0H16DRAFT_1497153 [Mycena metata]